MAAKKKVTAKNNKAKSVKVNDIIDSPKVAAPSSLRGKRISVKTLRRIGIVVVIVAIAYFAKGLFVASMVNYVPITRFEVIKALEKQGGKQVLDSLVTKKLIEQESAKKGVKVGDEEVQKEVDRVEKMLKDQGQGDLNTALTANGQTMDDFKDNIKVRLSIEKILSDKLNVSDDDIKSYFDQNKTYYTDKKLEDVKEEIRETLKEQKLSDEYQKWITDLKKNSKVYNFVNY